MFFTEKIPLSLYIHIPWCVRKCPYCDFNSHTLKSGLDEEQYIDSLIADFRESLPSIQNRPLHSIFFGGGTPSLFKPESYARLFKVIFQEVQGDSKIEITLEANPGTADASYFKGYREIGINRISLGVQSFNEEKLQKLGRIHSSDQAKEAFLMARAAGFNNINVDLMFGLPNQTIEEALSDLQQAIELKPEHLSWYQLTLEPNTVFYKRPPRLPDEDKLWEIEVEGKKLIQPYYQQYEISAYSLQHRECQHNLNYWLFGDYIGIGAGAHGKISRDNKIIRTQKKRQPDDYMNPQKDFLAKQEEVYPKDVLFEFMLNVLRLYRTIPYNLFIERTGLPLEKLRERLLEAERKGLILVNERSFDVTLWGHQYLNNLQEMFF